MKTEVLVAILQQNRNEINFWQDKLFTISSWINAAILGGVGFVIQYNLQEKFFWLVVVGFASLCAVYIKFTLIAKGGIESNGKDLLKVQQALRLHDDGAYLPNESIYAKDADRRWLPQTYTYFLIILNVAVVVFAISLLRTQIKLENGKAVRSEPVELLANI